MASTILGKVCITNKGAWSATATYAILDVVTANGSSYLAKTSVPAGTAVTNTTYWQLIAAKGDKGDTGEITGASATINGSFGTPSVSVTPGGTSTERTFAFNFSNLKGNGIESIAKTGTEGAVDTYTITFSDGTTTTFDVTNGSVTSVDGKTGAVVLDDKANIDGYYVDLTSGSTEQLLSTVQIEDKVPYNFRTSGGSADIGNRLMDKIVGGTICWNQLVKTNDTSVTVPISHKYIAFINGEWSMGISDGTALTVDGGNGDMIFDVSLMLHTLVVNHVYSLEQSRTGAGISWFRSLFPNDHYQYNAGEMLSVNVSSHDTVGFNAYDNTIGKAKLIGGMEYQITGAYTALAYSTGETITPDTNGYFTPSENGELSVTGGNATDTCVHLVWDGEKDGEFEEYIKHSYPLDSSLTLRGVPILDANNRLYYDGDIYRSDGTVVRRAVQLTLNGTESWEQSDVPSPNGGGRYFIHKIGEFDSVIAGRIISSKYQQTPDTTSSGRAVGINVVNSTPRNRAQISIRPVNVAEMTVAQFKELLAADPVTVVYILADGYTTAEEAEPYQNPQIVDDFGTEEYVDHAYSQENRDVAIPVGHDTLYMNNLRAKLEMSPDSPDGDGDYIVRQSGGENVYVPLTKELPAAPSEDGNYVLKVTVSDGTPTYTWEVQA